MADGEKFMGLPPRKQPGPVRGEPAPYRAGGGDASALPEAPGEPPVEPTSRDGEAVAPPPPEQSGGYVSRRHQSDPFGNGDDWPDMSPAAAEESPKAGWDYWGRHTNGRWIVGDAGRQPAVQPRASHRFRNSPPDTTIDGAEIGSITYRAASVRGLAHQERGEPRQDAYAVHVSKDQRWLVGCVSDGVSAGARSHEATAAICDRISTALMDHLVSAPPSDDPGGWAEEVDAIAWPRVVAAANDAVCELARPYLRRAAQRRGVTVAAAEQVPHSRVREIMSGTALAFMVATRPTASTGMYRAMLANVAGDSAAFMLQRERWIALVRAGNADAEVFPDAVRSLPGAAEVYASSFHLHPGDPLILMTDGLGDPLGSAKGSVGRFLGSQWRVPPDLLEFGHQLAFYRKTFADDRTAVVVWPGTAPDHR